MFNTALPSILPYFCTVGVEDPGKGASTWLCYISSCRIWSITQGCWNLFGSQLCNLTYFCVSQLGVIRKSDKLAVCIFIQVIEKKCWIGRARGTLWMLLGISLWISTNLLITTLWVLTFYQLFGPPNYTGWGLFLQLIHEILWDSWAWDYRRRGQAWSKGLTLCK